MHCCASKLIEQIKFFSASHRDVMFIYLPICDNFHTSAIDKEK